MYIFCIIKSILMIIRINVWINQIYESDKEHKDLNKIHLVSIISGMSIVVLSIKSNQIVFVTLDLSIYPIYRVHQTYKKHKESTISINTRKCHVNR